MAQQHAHIRDALVRSLSARLHRYLGTQEGEAVLDEIATRQAAQLRRAVPDPRQDREAVELLLALYQARLLAGSGREDRAAAQRDQEVRDALQRCVERAGWAEPSTEVRESDKRRLLDAAHEAVTLTEIARVALAAAVGDNGLTEQALTVCHEAVAAVPDELPHLRVSPLQLWSATLRLRYERESNPADLHACIAKLREVLSLIPSQHPDRAAVVDELGVALRMRYEAAGALADLDEAVRWSREATASSVPEGTEAAAGYSHNLGLALRRRYERLRRDEDLEEAVRRHRAAVAHSGRGLAGYATFQLGLGNVLGEIVAPGHGASPSPHAPHEVWSEQLAAYAEAAAHAESPDVAASAAAARARALTKVPRGAGPDTHLREPVLRTERIRTEHRLRRAMAGLPEGHPLLARIRHQLGRTLMERALDEHSSRLIPEALALHRAAARQPTADIRAQITAAAFWGTAAMFLDEPDEAADAYELAVGHLPKLARPHLALSDAEAGLNFPALASDAAACAWRAGDAERALRLLEAGRGVLLGQGMRSRDDLAELRAVEPRLARRLTALRSLFDRTENWASEHTGDLRHVGAHEWETLLTEIRVHLPGFWQPPALGSLLEQAAHGPVVMVNVSRYGSAGFVLTGPPPDGSLRTVPLPLLTPEVAESHSATLRHAHSRLMDPAAELLEHPVQQSHIRNVLAWLWEAVAAPVLGSLGPVERLWWVPTGPLAALPLHAAGHTGEPGMLDAAISSYTPTIAALAHARRPHRSEAVPPLHLVSRPSALIAAVPAPPGAPALARADEEAQLVTRLLPNSRLLQGPTAHREALLEALPGHPAAFHFSGHAVADPAAPSAGRLLAADHPLTVADIAALDLPGAHLAYLSACATAYTGPYLSDEALHLTSVLQMTGFHHAIGTLWAIDDTVALERVRAFYSDPQWVSDPALALHRATLAARDANPLAPSHWAAHVHSGA
ncbi:CHAT domain-containing protein [Streptomyces huasconensis]|uniref:CHAT domain-containing protein n=1 Tax=Streptomyces huasconensis TaxID=1854574 RepID=UPI0036FA0BEE